MNQKMNQKLLTTILGIVLILFSVISPCYAKSPSGRSLVQKFHMDARISPINASHSSELFKLIVRNRNHLSPWIEGIDEIRSIDDMKILIQNFTEEMEAGESIYWGIFNGSQLIGLVSLFEIDSDIKAGQIAYLIDKDWKGSGYALGATKSAIQYAFNQLELLRLIAKVNKENKVAVGFTKKLGQLIEENNSPPRLKTKKSNWHIFDLTPNHSDNCARQLLTAS